MEQDGTTMLDGRRVFFAGRLAGMSKRQAFEWVRKCGGSPCAKFDERVDWIVAAEPLHPTGDELAEQLEPVQRAAVEGRRAELVGESEFWRRLGLVDAGEASSRFYTLAMLADLIGSPASEVRRWYRGGLLIAAREVRRVPYFDFSEVTVARLLAELFSAGATLSSVQKDLAALHEQYPLFRRPLAELPLRAEGKRLLLREGSGLVETSGQRRFDFDAGPDESLGEPDDSTNENDAPPQVAELLAAAAEAEEQGDLQQAVELCRASLAAGGPKAETCFWLGELLYQLGEPAAACERYYMAVELDEDYVEARSNLGCILGELGRLDLAAAALQGALAQDPEYPDAHYHLARVLDELDRRAEADSHWRAFLRLAPDSPWADDALQRLGIDQG